MRAPKYYCTTAVWLAKDKFTLWLLLDEKIGNLLDDPLGIGRREKGRSTSGFGWDGLTVSTAGGGASWEESKWNLRWNHDVTMQLH